MPQQERNSQDVEVGHRRTPACRLLQRLAVRSLADVVSGALTAWMTPNSAALAPKRRS